MTCESTLSKAIHKFCFRNTILEVIPTEKRLLLDADPDDYYYKREEIVQ
jgi:hypothetical protein